MWGQLEEKAVAVLDVAAHGYVEQLETVEEEQGVSMMWEMVSRE